MRVKKGIKNLFVILMGVLSAAVGCVALLMFFALGWLPPALAWVLRAASAAFILLSISVVIKQLR